MTVIHNFKNHILMPLILIFAILLATGCSGTGKYMIDDPVNDPIMLTDDQQDSDLVKVEEGGGGSAGGGCPT